ncbi:c-type cytochrome [Sphingomonas piscis]|uniref:Photosynthetic reaction center cytochrome c subunit n=1 Tax=Sphingomonas piscis TaxID=2714943 RepID=A0A6G7YME6_9SPHN|nr:c-type cytochrome [Sphingomonas piscis]QIK77911.1 c-type cytochrome [Sphingomonas piscis]
MNWSSLVLAASAGALAFSVAAAQPTGAPPAPKNLQVLPKDMPRPQLMEVMKTFSSALGVKCTHCHAGTPPTMDFASDAKKEKQIARAMMRMVHRINTQDLGVKDMSQMKVTCFTCHRGATKPLTAAPTAPVSSLTPATISAERG